ncbi:hypothetical protein G7Y79_00006g018960 [Physcia stellaris]|nr:hypothetical protein G7Y79_00006g018960 [Physcia stellaris]
MLKHSVMFKLFKEESRAICRRALKATPYDAELFMANSRRIRNRILRKLTKAMNRLSDKLEEEDPVTQGLVDQLLYEESFSSDYNEDYNDHSSSVNSNSHKPLPKVIPDDEGDKERKSRKVKFRSRDSSRHVTKFLDVETHCSSRVSEDEDEDANTVDSIGSFIHDGDQD